MFNAAVPTSVELRKYVIILSIFNKYMVSHSYGISDITLSIRDDLWGCSGLKGCVSGL